MSRERRETMKKTYGIEVDCANCAQKMEDAAGKVEGVLACTVSFMTQKKNLLKYTEFSRKTKDFAGCLRLWQKQSMKVCTF